MIAIKHFRELIVRPVLDKLQLYNQDREELLVITCAQESLGGTYLMQNGLRGYPDGPALGIYQIEPDTYDDLFANFLAYRTRLWELLVGAVLHKPGKPRLIYDLQYATGVAAMQYYRFREPIPQNLEGKFAYYKRYWNSELGKATIPEVRRNYERFLASG